MSSSAGTAHSMSTSRDRQGYIDVLRVVATFAVIMIHVSGQNWYFTDVNSFTWHAFNFYDSICRWAVPVFVMMSGALFLPRDISLKTMYGKYILRIFVAFLFWSVIYAIPALASGGWSFVKEIVIGPGHMWFCLMIIGLYIVTPLLRMISANRKLTLYFLIISFCTAFLIPQIALVLQDIGATSTTYAGEAIAQALKDLRLDFVLGYPFYFLLGDLINRSDLNRQLRLAIYATGAAGFIATALMSAVFSHMHGQPVGSYMEYFTVNVMLEAIAVFVFAKYKFRGNRIWEQMARYSFGAFLVHMLILLRLDDWLGINTLSFVPAISPLVISLLIFIVAYIISAIINHIPFVNRYIC